MTAAGVVVWLSGLDQSSIVIDGLDVVCIFCLSMDTQKLVKRVVLTVLLTRE